MANTVKLSEKQKAQELVKKFREYSAIRPEGDYKGSRTHNAKQCAIMVVKEIIDYVKGWDKENELEFNESGSHVEYWETVIEEIQKL